MALSKAKDEEDNQIFKDEIADIKTEIDKYIKKIRKLTKQIAQIDIDLYGLPDKEIKVVQKQAQGRRPTAEQLALAELHKYDTAKIVKDDKTEKGMKDWLKKEAKKKAAKAAKLAAGLAAGEEDKDDDGEGLDGEDGGEGAELDMEGEGDGEGERA